MPASLDQGLSLADFIENRRPAAPRRRARSGPELGSFTITCRTDADFAPGRRTHSNRTATEGAREREHFALHPRRNNWTLNGLAAPRALRVLRIARRRSALTLRRASGSRRARSNRVPPRRGPLRGYRRSGRAGRASSAARAPQNLAELCQRRRQVGGVRGYRRTQVRHSTIGLGHTAPRIPHR